MAQNSLNTPKKWGHIIGNVVWLNESAPVEHERLCVVSHTEIAALVAFSMFRMTYKTMRQIARTPSTPNSYCGETPSEKTSPVIWIISGDNSSTAAQFKNMPCLGHWTPCQRFCEVLTKSLKVVEEGEDCDEYSRNQSRITRYVPGLW